LPAVAGLTPLLGADSPLDPHARALVEDLFRREHEAAFDLPTDDPLDPGRRRRVELTLPEILEQPEVIRRTLEQERKAVRSAARELTGAGLERMVFTGCGDSLAVMVGVRALFETLTGVPCEPVQALGFAYYHHRPIGPRTLVVTLSSSGMTTRTVEAMLIARARGARSLALTNTPGSALMVESDHAILVHARRRGWPTQASTAAMALLAQLAIDMAGAGERGGAADRSAGRLQAALDAAPDAIANTIERHDAAIAALAARQAARAMYLFAAGGPSYACALFGAAKVKECTPNHAIAIPLEEFHHYNSQKRGDPLFLIAPEGPSVPRARDTAAQGRRWGGSIHSVVTEGDETLTNLSDTVLRLPPVPELIAPLVYFVPVQLFAYHLAMAQFRLAEETSGR
jgi:glutamine---fructose-6-phosphate transaminase (isomerizing)